MKHLLKSRQTNSFTTLELGPELDLLLVHVLRNDLNVVAFVGLLLRVREIALSVMTIHHWI